MFNRTEQVALLFLCGSFLVGSAVSIWDYHRPSALDEFRVIHKAVPVPTPVAVETTETQQPIRLNSGSEGELEQLPTIGPKTALRIVEYRRQHGAFKTLEDLLNIHGVGQRTLEKIRPHVVLE
jgi:competence ComEA-like helix-hairpin-helix protein